MMSLLDSNANPYLRPVRPSGTTEASFAGLRVPLRNVSPAALIENTDPQMRFRRFGNIQETNPLAPVGRLLSDTDENTHPQTHDTPSVESAPPKGPISDKWKRRLGVMLDGIAQNFGQRQEQGQEEDYPPPMNMQMPNYGIIQQQQKPMIEWPSLTSRWQGRY